MCQFRTLIAAVNTCPVGAFSDVPQPARQELQTFRLFSRLILLAMSRDVEPKAVRRAGSRSEFHEMGVAERDVRRDGRGKDSALEDCRRCTGRNPSKGHRASP